MAWGPEDEQKSCSVRCALIAMNSHQKNLPLNLSEPKSRAAPTTRDTRDFFSPSV